MNKLLLFLLTIALYLPTINAQFILLDDIANNATSGLGLSLSAFNDKSDNLLYFEGSTNQFNFTVYQTDGTAAGTTKSVSSNALNNPSEIYFGQDIIYVKDIDDGLKLKTTDGTDAGTNTISFFNGVSFGDAYIMGQNAFFLGSSNTEVYGTDGTDAGSSLLGSLEGTSFNIAVSTNDSIGVFYDRNITDNFQARIVHNNTTEMSTVAEYLAPYISVDNIRSVSVVNEFIMFQAAIDGSVEDKIFNILTNEVNDFRFVGELIEGFELNGRIVVLTNFDAFSFDPITLENEELVNSNYAFTTVEVTNDKAYFVADVGSGFQYVETDGTQSGTKGLINTPVVTTAFDPRQAVFNEKLYYLDDPAGNTPKTLKEYNLVTDEIITIGEMAEQTGGFVVTQGIFVVNGALVVSKFTAELGHELYVYDGVSNTFSTLNDINIELINTIATTKLSYNSDISLESIVIYAADGKQVMDCSTIDSSKTIDVSQLASGMYFARFVSNEGYKTLRFYKE